MRGTWLVVLMIGCGFQSRAPGNAGSDGGAIPDGGFDARTICSSIAKGDPQFKVTACATPAAASIDVSRTMSIDTDRGTSTPSGLTCAALADGSDRVCALVASSITVHQGAVLSAHGTRPLALLAHSITIQGTVDVASHIGGTVGAGSHDSGCAPGTLPTGAGGGQGGGADGPGGFGGNAGGGSGFGGQGGYSYQVTDLLGGCGGTPGGRGADGDGGAGGGAVWIVSDKAPLAIESGAVINASGASGAGGATEGHGGSGGGAGGVIVLQASSIQLDAAAMIFANGGHGGGGAGANATDGGFEPGDPGIDPTGPMSGGSGGTGGIDGSTAVPNPNSPSGSGGAGYPAMQRNGELGVTPGHGGGGGGGGAGAIRVVSSTNIAGPNVSPPPVSLE